MLLISIIYTLSSNAVAIRRDKSIVYSRSVIATLIVCLIKTFYTFNSKFLDKGIGIYHGLFHTTAISHIFQIFILIISILILQLNSFFPRKVWTKNFSSLYKLIFCKFVYFNSFILNKMAEQFRILEYSLIILFIIIGGVLLVSCFDLISIFLAIELQSYGLYLLCSIYRDSEKATSAGLTYFLLGGLSSCFILLASSLLYANSGNTGFDGLYIINNISNAKYSIEAGQKNFSVSYKSYYINSALAIMSVGFLFKVTAAPFHFWSPEWELGKFSNIGTKLLNSGDLLKLLVPSNNRKVVSGWSNYSGKVTSQKISENEMDNRGSKSVICASQKM